jgi:hypothetical protein
LQGSLTNTECPVNINAAACQAGAGQIRLDSKTTLQDNQRHSEKHMCRGGTENTEKSPKKLGILRGKTWFVDILGVVRVLAIEWF